MKGKRLLSALSEVLLAALPAWSGLMCLVTAFDITYAKLWVLPLWCLGCAAVWVCCLRWKKGLLLGAVFTAALLWWGHRANALLSLEALVHHISRWYHNGYGWGTVSWSGEVLSGVDVTAALCMIALLVTLAMADTLVKGSSCSFGGTAAALPVAACLLLTNTVPDEIYLFLFLLGLLLLLMTQNLRLLDSFHAARLTAMLLIPCAVLLGALFLLIPQEGYHGQAGADRLEEAVVRLFDSLPKSENSAGNDDGDMGYRVDLEDVGPKEKEKDKVMQVVLGKSGTLYLRGRAFSAYSGESWSVGGDWTLDTRKSWEDSRGSGAGVEVAITTETVHSVLYLPYVCVDPEVLEQMDQGCVRNSGGILTYKLTQMPARTYDASWEETPLPEDYGCRPGDNGYAYIPFDTCQRAEKHLQALGIQPEGTYETMAEVWHTANKIAGYVRSSAGYDLNTPKMPQGEDFALWFLEESDTGYCTHFASATAVLLRAAGIPARFVTGYMVSGRAGQSVAVRLENAHAWVEYYIEGAGWVLLESTASGDASPVIPTEQTTAPAADRETGPQTATQQTEGTTRVTAPADGEKPKERVPVKLTALWWLLGIAAGIGTVLGQWRLRLYLYAKAIQRGSTNQQALVRWRRLRQIYGLLKQELDRELYELALKAKFSQHSITREELELLEESIAYGTRMLKGKNPAQQLLYRLVYGLY